MRVLKVKELVEILSKADPESHVLIPGGDHSYQHASAENTTAMLQSREYYEDHGEKYTPEGDEHGSRIRVVVIS